MTTAIQIGLVDLINFLAIKPSVVVGHSSGEIAAAYCAGFLCHESAMRVSYYRGVLATELAQNSKSMWGMASIGLSANEVLLEAKELQDQDPGAFDSAQINISCMNSSVNTTISGPVASLDLVIAHLNFKNIFARKLKVDVGYHSPQMNSLSYEYFKYVANLRPGAEVNSIRMVSSVLPGLVDGETVCCGEYWIRNMVSPVRFFEAMDICCKDINTADVTKKLDRSHSQQIFTDGWLEIGPHATLKGPLREIFSSKNRKDLFYASLLVRNNSAIRTVLETVGRLFCQGFEVDLGRIARIDEAEPRETRTIVDLPRYPFNHSAIHWEESARTIASRLRIHEQHPLLGAQVIDWNPLNASWRFIIRKDDIPWVSDHRLHGNMWYPAAGMIVMAVEAVKQLLSDAQFNFELRDVTFTAPIVVSETSEGTETQISVVPASNMRGNRETDYKFRIFVRRMDDTWNEACDGTIIPQKAQKAALDVNKQDEEEHKRRRAQIAYDKALVSCKWFIEASEMYHKAHENSGLQYGPSFQCLLTYIMTEEDRHMHS
jgi:acyl transferase domain-containing protein